MLTKRLIAFIIDMAILFFALYALSFVNDEILPSYSVLELIFALLIIAICFSYFPVQWVLWGRTYGMKLMRLKIMRADGSPITTWDAIVRCCFSFFDLMGLVGLILIKYKGQSIADMSSKTRVVDTTTAPLTSN